MDQAVTNIPMSPVATLYVSLTQEGGPALGQVIAGQAWPIGTTQYNTRLGIRDYSRKDTDEFGNTRLVKRANAKRTSLPLYLHPSRLEACGKSSPGYMASRRCGLATTTRASVPTSR